MMITSVILNEDGTVRRAMRSAVAPEGAYLMPFEVSVTDAAKMIYLGTVEVEREIEEEQTVYVDDPDGEPYPVTQTVTVTETVEEDIWETRPQSPAPVQVSPGEYVVLDCDEGTVIEVADIVGGELMARVVADADGFSQEFSFPDPGTYSITVTSPTPYLETQETFEVSV